MQVRDVMTTRVITVAPDTEVAEIARCLLENRISAVPVVETDGRLVAVVSEGDLMRRSESGTEHHPPGGYPCFCFPNAVQPITSRRTVAVLKR